MIIKLKIVGSLSLGNQISRQESSIWQMRLSRRGSSIFGGRGGRYFLANTFRNSFETTDLNWIPVKGEKGVPFLLISKFLWMDLLPVIA